MCAVCGCVLILVVVDPPACLSVHRLTQCLLLHGWIRWLCSPALLVCSIAQFFVPDQFIYRAGEMGSELFIVCHGQVRVFRCAVAVFAAILAFSVLAVACSAFSVVACARDSDFGCA